MVWEVLHHVGEIAEHLNAAFTSNILFFQSAPAPLAKNRKGAWFTLDYPVSAQPQTLQTDISIVPH